jgi:hypothetical protein
VFTITGGNANGAEFPMGTGGGMLNMYASPTVTSCVFEDNSGGSGGGMSNYWSSPQVADCTFRGNTGSPDGSGGAMVNFVADTVVTDCIFEYNSAGSGGAVVNDTSYPTVIRSAFEGNSADSGGAMLNYVSSPTVTNSEFEGNSAGYGGAIYDDYNSGPALTNCVFSCNTGTFGEVMYTGLGTFPRFSSCTLLGDSALPSVGISEDFSSPVVTVENSVFWGFTTPIAGDATVVHSDVQGGYEGTGNIDADPLFVSTTDLHLQSISPCIDTGSNDAVPDDVTTDLDGNPRIVDGNGDTTATVDMGSYEYQP